MGMGRRYHLLLLGGGGRAVRCPGVIKEKSPDSRSTEVGISASILAGKELKFDLTFCLI